MTSKKRFIFFSVIFWFAIVCCVFVCGRTQKTKDLSIVFSKSGNVSEYDISGFSMPEEGHVWTDGEFASVKVPVPEIDENKFFRVSLDAAPFIGKRLKKQTVEVFVNDEFITDFVMTGSGMYKFDLPRDLQKSGNVATIKFKISNPMSPKDLKISSDTRKLGISVKKITLSTVDANNPNNFATYDIGDEILFAKSGNAEKYMASGWSLPEQNFTWTNGKDAVINMFVNKAKDKQLQLNISGHAIFGAKAKNQKITVYANDQELTTWEVGKDYGTYSVKLPESVVQNGALQIRLHIDKPVKVGQDPRDLGMAVNMIKVSQVFAAKTKSKMANWVKNNVLTDSEKTTEKSK